MVIVTNFVDFPSRWASRTGLSGVTQRATLANEFLEFRSTPEAIFLVNCDVPLTFNLVREQAFGPRRPIIAVDLILRRPKTWRAKLSLPLKRRLFRRVDYFLNYFTDLDALQAVYGIGPDRSGFVPFKANLWGLQASAPQPGGDYVLCFGRSLRDFDTFFTAIEKSGCPGAIVNPQSADVWAHGSRFTRPLSALPANVRVLEHDLSNSSQASVIHDARIVVIPILKETLISAGIGTTLNSMLLGKCVIATAGPGVTDLFQKEVVSVPPEDPDALAAAIRTVWNDDGLRRTTAQAGWEYACRCGSLQDFYQRIIDAVAAWHLQSRFSTQDPG